MNAQTPSAAPNYTNPALAMLGVNLTCSFVILWALYGLIPVLLIAAGLNHGLSRLTQYRDDQR